MVYSFWLRTFLLTLNTHLLPTMIFPFLFLSLIIHASVSLTFFGSAISSASTSIVKQFACSSLASSAINLLGGLPGLTSCKFATSLVNQNIFSISDILLALMLKLNLKLNLFFIFVVWVWPEGRGRSFSIFANVNRFSGSTPDCQLLPNDQAAFWHS